MGQAENRLKNYSILRAESPRDWGADPSRHRYAKDATADGPARPRCEHLTLVPPERPEEFATLDELLLEMLGDEFSQRLLGIVEGRELDFFAADPLISRLIRALRTPEARAAIETKLDELFVAHERGKFFEHSEIAMGLLYAAKMARIPGWDEMLIVFANAKSAEFVALRRFARVLQRR